MVDHDRNHCRVKCRDEMKKRVFICSWWPEKRGNVRFQKLERE